MPTVLQQISFSILSKTKQQWVPTKYLKAENNEGKKKQTEID